MENLLKADIKLLAEGQSALKEQRKTVHFEGERTLTPNQAFSKHLENRHQLRLLYAAQGLLKGRTLEQIETKNRPDVYPLSVYTNSINKLIVKYATPIVHSN